MIVVLVVDSEFTKLLPLKITSAPRTYPGMDLERFLPITPLSLLTVAPRLTYKPVQSAFV